MSRPQIERWVGNHYECESAIDAIDRGDELDALVQLYEASRHNFVDFPERRNAFAQAKAYIERVTNTSYQELLSKHGLTE